MPPKKKAVNKNKKPYYKKKKVNAYKKKNKRAFKKASNPLAENKRLIGSELAAFLGENSLGGRILTDYSTAPANQDGHIMDSATWNFNPDSMIYQTHGFEDNQMIGRNVYQTLCAAKFLIKWPQPSMRIGINKYGTTTDLGGVTPQTPMNYKLYWGYIPRKLMQSSQTTPTQTAVSAYYIENEINQRVREYFDQRQDRIQFIPKQTSTLRISGSKRLYPPWERQTGRFPVNTQTETSQIATIDGDPVVYHPNTLRTARHTIPDTLVKIKWPINRKIHFEPSTSIGANTEVPPAANISTTPTTFYRNYDWLPFAVIVSYNHDNLPANDPSNSNPDLRHERTRRCPQVLVNDICYYRDS